MSRRRLLSGLRGAAGIALLWILIDRVDVGRLGEALATCRIGPAFAGAALLLVAAGVQILRFHVLAGSLVSGPRDSARITLVSAFFNQVSPGGLGGEVYRAVRLRRASDRWSAAMALILVERLVGGAMLLVPALIWAVATRSRLQALVESRWIPGRISWPGQPEYWLAAVALLGIGAVVAVAASGSIRRWITRARSTLGSQLAGLPASRYRNVAALSMLYHLLRLLGFSSFGRAVGETLPWGDWLLVLAAALLASLIPLSLGALGLREGAIVAGLALFGVESADGLAVALFNRLVLVLLALVGGCLLLAARRGTAPAAVDSGAP